MSAGLGPAQVRVPAAQVGAAARTAAAPAAGRVSTVRVIRSEWTKLRALRSTWCCALLAVVLIVGLGVAIAASGTKHPVSPKFPAAAAISVSLIGVLFAQLVLGALGVLVFSGEYGTGMIRASLAVVPARLPVLWAKLVVLTGLVLPVALLAAVIEFFAVTALHSAHGTVAITLADPGVLRTVVGAALYLSVAAVIGVALGCLLRKTAAGLSVFTAMFIVAPIVAPYLPHASAFARYLPSSAGGALWGQPLAADPLGPWAGFAVLCGYAVVLVGLAAWRLRRADA
jgi:ABC-2 type transport system permease protein